MTIVFKLVPKVSRGLRRNGLGLLLAVGVVLSVEAAPASESSQAKFSAPQGAAQALVQAARDNDPIVLQRILGSGAGRVIASGDAAQDERTRQEFLAAAAEAVTTESLSVDKAIVLLGQRAWPLPFPLTRDAQGQWYFDTRAGLREFLDRQIGANELDAMEAVRAYVDAQREYVLRDRNRNGLLEYAQSLISTEGQRDGLYWPVEPGQPLSPLGAALGVAEVRSLRPSNESPQPYRGYFFRVLTAQGPAAPGGALDYRVGTRLIGGYALVAYPARWGVSGVMAFIVNHQGVVYSRNLGKDTARIATSMLRYDPGPGWKLESAAQAGSSGNSQLVDTNWRLMSASGGSRIAPSLQLSSEGRVAGSDGCNRLVGGFTLDGDRIRFLPLAASRASCPAMKGRDADFQRAVAETAQWRISGSGLQLLAEDGRLLLRLERTSQN